MKKLQSKRHPIMLLDEGITGEGGGRRRYVLDTDVDPAGCVRVVLSEESVIDPGPREEIYGADRICLDTATARWLLDRLPGLIAQAEAIEDELCEQRERALRRGGRVA